MVQVIQELRFDLYLDLCSWISTAHIGFHIGYFDIASVIIYFGCVFLNSGK
jgi:hypothetical protein